MATATAIIPADELGEQLLVALGQRVVEDLAQQERRDHAQARAETMISPRTIDQRPPVRPEERA